MDQVTQHQAPLGEMLGWMSSLADSTRTRILRLVESHELSVAEICSVLQAPQSTVSRHLKVLADEGWIVARRQATSRLYGIDESLAAPAHRLWGLVREQASGSPVADQDDQRLQGVIAQRRTRSQAFFSSAAGQWDLLRDEMYGNQFDRCGVAALLDETWTVADLGCGTGAWAEGIAPFVTRVLAVDSSTAMLKAARARLSDQANVEVRRGDLEALPIEERSLDAANIGLVLHHAPTPTAVLREAARVLVPGGRLLILDMFPHERVEYQRQMGHVWLGFEPTQIEQWLHDAGFGSVRITALPADPHAKGPALFAAVARRRDDTTDHPDDEQNHRRKIRTVRRRKK